MAGQTVLHIAARYDQSELAVYLLSRARDFPYVALECMLHVLNVLPLAVCTYLQPSPMRCVRV